MTLTFDRDHKRWWHTYPPTKFQVNPSNGLGMDAGQSCRQTKKKTKNQSNIKQTEIKAKT